MTRLAAMLWLACGVLGPGTGAAGTAVDAAHALNCGQSLDLPLGDSALHLHAAAGAHWFEHFELVEQGIDVVLSVQRGSAAARTLDGFPSKLTREHWLGFAPRESRIEIRPKYRGQAPGRVLIQRRCGLPALRLSDWWTQAVQAAAQQALADLEYDRAETFAAAWSAWQRTLTWLHYTVPSDHAGRAWRAQAQAYAAQMAGHPEQAPALLQTAVDAWQAAGRTREAAVAAFSLAVATSGRSGIARPAAELAARLAASAGDRYWELMARQQLCLLQRQDGDEAGGQRCYQAMLSAYAAIGERYAPALAAHNLAVALRSNGEWSKAFALAERALKLVDPRSRNYVRVLSLLGRLALDHGQISRAIALLADAAEAGARHRHFEDQVSADLDLTRLYLSLGDTGRAERLLRLVDTAGVVSWRLAARQALLQGQLALLRRDPQAARLLHAAADRYAEKQRVEHAQATRILAAQAELRAGDASAAGRTLEALDPGRLPTRQRERLALLRLELAMATDQVDAAALTQALQEPAPGEVFTAMRRDLLLAAALLAHSAADPATQALAAATLERWIDRLAQAIAQSQSPAVQVALRRQAEPFLAVLAQWRLHGAGGSDAARVASLWLLAERLRARPQRDAGERIDPELVDGSARWLAQQVLHDEAESAAGTAARDEEALLRALDRRTTTPLRSADVAVTDLLTSFRQLPAGTTVLELLPGEQHSWMLVARQDGVAAWPLPAAADLQSAIAAAHDWASGAAGSCSQCADLLAWLQPALAGSDELVVVGSGVLSRLPFAALPLTTADAEPQMGLLAISHASQLWRAAPGTASASSAAPVLTLLAATTGGRRDAGETRLPALPGARAEVEALADQLGADRVRVLLDAQASPEALRTALAEPGADLLLAAHGVADPRRWYRAGLMLEDKGGLAPVTLPQILEWPVRARRVYFSACSTVPELAEASDQVLSLGAALLASGAAEIVGSQWEVSDRAAMLLTQAFHARPELDSARALRHAQSQLLATRAFRAPRYWAGFRVLRSGILERR